MEDISLRKLLEAGCHFGHKKERWHPKASKYIFDTREGIHIIDLAKTRDGLKSAMEYVKKLGEEDKVLLFVATKRQAKGVVTDAAKLAGAPYLTKRWIGGFFTNWDEVKKNIDKMNKGRKEKTDGTWQKFPKHEIVKMDKILHRQEVVYGGVAEFLALPDAVFIVDIKKEISTLREALKRNIPTIAVVDTNTDPTSVDYPIPANDDAVGSIQIVVNYIVQAYMEGKKLAEKKSEGSKRPENVSEVRQEVTVEKKSVPEPIKTPEKEEKKEAKKASVTAEKKSAEKVKPILKKNVTSKKAAKSKKESK